MADNEIRDTILRKLKETYDTNPHGDLDKEDLLSTLGVSETELDRNIKYLGDKGYIDVEWFLGGGFFARINSYGIDKIEEKNELLVKETEKISECVEHDVFIDIKNFVDAELTEICHPALEKLQLCFEELSLEPHPHRNRRVAFDCREILKDFTDAIFKDEYLQNEETKPTREHTKNKLRYTLRAIEKTKKMSETSKNLLDTQIDYFNALYDFIQKNAHLRDFENSRDDAKRCFIYTYLIIGGILRLLKQKGDVVEGDDK